MHISPSPVVALHNESELNMCKAWKIDITTRSDDTTSKQKHSSCMKPIYPDHERWQETERSVIIYEI